MKTVPVEFQVNRKPVSASVAPGLSLLRFLRDHLRLTGTKNGCSQGHCGSCMVLLDGRPTRSCLVKMGSVSGKRVDTIEGVGKNGSLHPLQRALIDANAIQCGFCIPGMVISGVALLERNREPSPDEIREALSLNLCRCGGYPKIIRAVQGASRIMAGTSPAPSTRHYVGQLVGQSVLDPEGEEKVTGGMAFADDMYLDNMLWGKILRSRYPHARILAVDVSRAERVSGVAAVLTCRDIPGRNGFGVMNPHQPVLCFDKVRYLGDPVAVVFAETSEAAENGLREISVEYEDLPVVGSVEQALEPGAPEVHPGGNVCHHVGRQVGNVEQGFREADVIVEGDYRSPFVEHAYMEPESGLGVPTPDGRVTVYYPDQTPFENRSQIAAALAVPEDRVRVVTTPIGGGFGGKSEITVQILVALGALRTGRPCKITLTRQESLVFSSKRHAFRSHIKVGARLDGALTAVESKMVCEAGPYDGFSPWLITLACNYGCGHYVVPNARIDGWAFYTNNASGGAFRGFGLPQAEFALESSLDILARKLGLDPFEIRLRNAAEVGSPILTGEVLQVSVPFKETIRVAREALERANLPESKGKKRIGVGVASGVKNVGPGMGFADGESASVELSKDGEILVRAATVDMGQGSRGAMTQIAADAIGAGFERIRLLTGDTDLVHWSMGGAGQRQTFCGGNAILGASQQFRQALLSYVARQYNTPVERLSLQGDYLMDGAAPLVSLEALGRFTAGEGEAIKVDYYYDAPKTYPLFADRDPIRRTVDRPQLGVPLDPSAERPADYRNYYCYAYATHIAVVEVDEGSGSVKVLKLIAVQDLGRAINPERAEAQLESGCIMGIGFALTEQYRVENGIHLTKNLGQCHIPTIKDAPPIECVIVESPDPNGPLGAKGVAEMGMMPVAPAIANAIYDAVGVRITDLPATRDKVLEALRLRSEHEARAPEA